MTVASGEINLQKSKHDRTHVAKVKAAFHSWHNKFFSIFNILFESNASIKRKENTFYMY